MVEAPVAGGGVPADERARLRRVWLRAAWFSIAINLVAGLLVLVFFALWLSPAAVGRAGAGSLVGFAAVFGVFVVAVGGRTVREDRRRLSAIEHWMDQGWPIGGRGWSVVLNEPARQARTSLAAWWAGSALFALTYAVETGAWGRTGLLLIGALLAGLNVGADVGFVTEHVLRPLTAKALAQGWPKHRTGVHRRLLLAWATGSGIPIFGIALALVWQQSNGGSMIGPLWALVVTGLVAGWIVIATAARLLADSVEAVRGGLLRLETGDLTAAVTVDDSSEVGLLQAGFNRMVAGLRERELLHDLFGRHVGVDVARTALERGVSLGGEVQDVSVLFVDLAGSTTLVEHHPPQEVVAVLNAFFAAVVRTTHAEGGWVNKFEGDAALCVFGAPEPLDDHAACALRAACQLRALLSELGAVHPGIDAGIGVSSGTVVAGNIGAEDRYEYTVVGRPVNEAARLTEIAKGRPERIVASLDAVCAAGDEGRRWISVGAVDLRGRSQPTDVHVPLITGEVRSQVSVTG